MLTIFLQLLICANFTFEGSDCTTSRTILTRLVLTGHSRSLADIDLAMLDSEYRDIDQFGTSHSLVASAVFPPNTSKCGISAQMHMTQAVFDEQFDF